MHKPDLMVFLLLWCVVFDFVPPFIHSVLQVHCVLDPARYLVHCYVHCEIVNLSREFSIHQKLWDCRHMQFERVCAKGNRLCQTIRHSLWVQYSW